MSNGPFYRNGEDAFETDTLLNRMIWLFLVFYALVVIVYIGVFINNSSREHTYFKYPGAVGPGPGTLTSHRYDIYWFAYFFSAISVITVPFAILLMIVYRESRDCSIGWMVVTVVLMLLQVFSVFVLFGAMAQCNHDGQVGNPCNSKVWCCVPAVVGVLANGCPNFGPCPGGPFTRAELSMDGDFLWVFWINIWILAANTIYMLTVAWYWTKSDVVEEVMTTVENPKEVSSSVGGMIKRNHGLKQRK